MIFHHIPDDYQFKFKWKVVEKQERYPNTPQFILYRKVMFVFWMKYADYTSLEEAKENAHFFEEFMTRPTYEKVVWRT